MCVRCIGKDLTRFFFQAEDGIRDLVRSRGLGDVYKRQRILSLTDNTPYILAWGNDEGFDRIFVEQLKNLALSLIHI